MGLATSQARLLTLTSRKASCERGLSIDANRKLLLTREMSQLTRDYNSKLSQKQVVYFEDGKFNKINYGHLMGYGSATGTYLLRGTKSFKSNNKMILTDYQGRVVMHQEYANAIMNVCGVGPGETFSADKIPEILVAVTGHFSADEFRDGISSYVWDATATSPVSGNSHGVQVDTTDIANEQMQTLLDFFLPIFRAAATNGWTTEYNSYMANNEDYLSDALASGSFILTEVNEYGFYDSNATLTYFATTGDIDLKDDVDKRKELEAWYNDEKERITAKETIIDLDMQDLSTEVEAIKTEIESVKSFIDDAVQSVFNWGNG